MIHEKEDCNEERKKLWWILEKEWYDCFSKQNKIWLEYFDGIRPGGVLKGLYEDAEYIELGNRMGAISEQKNSIEFMPCKKVRGLLEDSSPPEDSLDGLVDKSQRMMPYNQLLGYFKGLSLGQLLGLLPGFLRGPISMINMISGARGMYKEYGKIIKTAIQPVAKEFDSFTAYGNYLDSQIIECTGEIEHYSAIIEDNKEFIQVAIHEYENIPPQNTKEKKDAENILINLLIEHFFSLIIIKDLLEEEVKVYKHTIDEIFDDVLREQEQL